MRKLWFICFPVTLMACTSDNPGVGATSEGDTDPDATTGATTGASTTTATATVTDSDTAGTDSGTGGAAVCGDGIVEGAEECDDGAANDDAAPCKSDCTSQVCGDGALGSSEACDDGNTEDLDDCSNDCIIADCGDGVISGVEECDDAAGNDDTAPCKSNCVVAVCGDGLVNAGVEECDDNNPDDADGCSNACVLLPFCGDGVSVAGEVCYVPLAGALPDTKSEPTDVKIADVTNDGILDVVVSQWTFNQVRIFENDGTGGLTIIADLNTGGAAIGDLEVADFDGDSRADIAVTTLGTDKTVFLFGTQAIPGDPVTFAAPVDKAAVGGLPVGLDARDLNGDGRADYVVTERGENFTCYSTVVYLGQANQTLSPASTGLGECGQANGAGLDVVIGDFRGIAGKYQFAVSRPDFNQIDLFQGYDMMAMSVTEIPLGAGARPLHMATGAINADALDDLVVPIEDLGCDYQGNINACTGDEVWLFLGDATDTLFPTPFPVQTTAKGVQAVAIDDVTADGSPDVVVVSRWDAEITVLTNDSLGNLSEANTYSTMGTRPVALDLGDLNGDGIPDIVAVNRDSDDLMVYYSNP